MRTIENNIKTKDVLLEWVFDMSMLVMKWKVDCGVHI